MSGGWLDDNEGRRWPFRDDADVGGLPDAIFADLRVVYPDTLSGDPHLASISVGASYLSFVLRVGTTDVAWYGGEKRDREVLSLTPLVDGVSGTVVLGTGIHTWQGREEPSGAILAPETAQRYLTRVLGRLTVQKAGIGSVDLTGAVNLQAGASISMIQHTDIDIETDEGTITAPMAIEFSLALAPDSDQMRAISGHNNRRVINQTCDPDAINYVNAVRPSADGDLTLRFAGSIVSIEALPAELRLNTDLSATRSCDNQTAIASIPVADPECP